MVEELKSIPPGTLAATNPLIEAEEAVRVAGAAGTDTGPAAGAEVSERDAPRIG
ncbi:MAG: hypothetical protein P8J89_07930 [Phycisphaerales bacterium]|nr:hypothetical protein [Phycisphaerales bacterium]|tara:strand:- start:2189 stop:2350 length:162 start_codon:yes stop_codon:yes gene_type:complete